ncbi:MAG: GHKL domain-containing protein [Clostridiaceae bacterium]
MEIEQQKFYNESLNSTIFNLRRFKHDWNNNLTVINSMLNMNKISELKQYLSELIHQNSDSLDTAIYNIKNAGLFGIISSKLNQARDMGISVDFTVNGEIENIPEIKISELCEVIGIFIDNALEEATKADKSINLSIYSDDRFLEITISNNCASKPDIKMIYEEGYSSKGEGRGLGLAIARKILSKYKNIQHITDFEDNAFTQTITIEKGL